jgi:type III secretion protein S
VNEHLIGFVYRGLNATLYLCGPPLVLVVVLGLLLSILQAAMHLQDQITPQIIKASLIALVIYVFGRPLSEPLLELTNEGFSFAAFRF